MTVLSVRNLETFYGAIMALRGVSIDVDEGEIVTILGANGAGKTTLMKTIAGLMDPEKGAITYKGETIARLAPDRIVAKGISLVPEGREVFPYLTIEENLKLGAFTRHGGQAQDLELVYGYFPILKERRDQRAGTLSGGQQQQLAIGRVLMGDPAMILLDEPSEGIQPNIVQDIARIMVELNRDTGITVVFVEQNLDMIRQMAERCYVMDKGTVTAEIGKEALEDRDTVRRYLAV